MTDAESLQVTCGRCGEDVEPEVAPYGKKCPLCGNWLLSNRGVL